MEGNCKCKEIHTNFIGGSNNLVKRLLLRDVYCVLKKMLNEKNKRI